MIRNRIVLKCAAFLCMGLLVSGSLPVYAQEGVLADEGEQEWLLEDDSQSHEEVLESEEEDLEPITPEQISSGQESEGEQTHSDGKNEEEQVPSDQEAEEKQIPSDQEPEEEQTPLDQNSGTEQMSSEQESESEELSQEEMEEEITVGVGSETGTRQYVRRLYEVLLERQPDTVGMDAFVRELDSGAGTAGDIAALMIDSQEFRNKKDSNQEYVEKLYAALFGRKAGGKEAAEWAFRMDNGVSQRYILAQFVNSDEFESICRRYGIQRGEVQITESRDKNYEVSAYVSRCYRNILEREADVEGLNTWTEKILSGGSGAEIVKDLVFSREFEEHGKSDSEFLDIMYQAMLGRAADAGGKANWMDCLQKGVSYRYVINGFAGSEEFNGICGAYGILAGNVEITEARDKNVGVTGYVVRNYKVILGRMPDLMGLNEWCDLINCGIQTAAQVSYGFVFSEEVANKGLSNEDFVELLYEACLGRPSDPSGKQDWVNRLNTGTKREDIFWGFANSTEFNQMVAEFGMTGSVYETIELMSCEATAYSGLNLSVSLRAKRNEIMEKMAQYLYVVLLDSQGEHIVENAKLFSEVNGDWMIHADFGSSDSFRTAAVGKYAIAVMFGDNFQVLSDSIYLSNPEIMAITNKTYPGFYEGELSSKKGMQGVHAYATEELGIQAALLNIKLNELIRTSTNVAKFGSACYTPYVYKGKTYYFHDMISYMSTVKGLNGWTDEYGRIYRNVTLNLLLSWDNELQYLIHPSARSWGHVYYTLNMEEADSRETFEALFCYMAEKLGGSVLLPSEKSPYKYRVANWVLGNEVNACQVWNYSGNMSTQECADNYAKAFQILYQGVKRTDSEARIFISLDHDWNAWENGHGGKAFLDEFASYMHATAPHMRWNVDYHPYSQPLPRNDFWNDYSNTTSDINTRFISMRNLDVLTNYLGELERRYFPRNESGYIRVILGEQGFVAANKGQEASQAAAIGYGFYIASMNTRVDAYIIRAYKDDPAEGVMKLGVMYQDETRKESYDVYALLGTKDSITCMDRYLPLVNKNASSWTQVIPSLDLRALYH